MYLSSILGYLMWPVIILISYWFVRVALRRFEKRYSEDNS